MVELRTLLDERDATVAELKEDLTRANERYQVNEQRISELDATYERSLSEYRARIKRLEGM